MIEEGLKAYLATQSSITTLISGRVYPLILPQNATFPCASYSRTGSQRHATFDERQTDYVGAEIQVDAWGETYTEAKALIAALRASLQNYKGTMGTTSVDHVEVVAEIDVYEESVEKYRCSMSFTIWHTEA